MKKHLAARMRLPVLVIAGALGTFALVTPHLVEAQSAPEKIRLMADTLRARDSGNLDLAKEKAEELIKIAPKDDNVQRLLGAINKELDRRGDQVTSAVYGQANSQDIELAMDLPSTADAATVVDTVTGADAVVAEAAADQSAKIAVVKDAIADAQDAVIVDLSDLPWAIPDKDDRNIRYYMELLADEAGFTAKEFVNQDSDIEIGQLDALVDGFVEDESMGYETGGETGTISVGTFKGDHVAVATNAAGYQTWIR